MTTELQVLLDDCKTALTTARLHYEAQAKPDDRRRTAHLAEQAGELVGRIEGMMINVNEGRPESNG